MRLSHWFSLAAVVALAIGSVAFAWIGFIESDDVAYSQAAQAWIDHFPYVGSDHWALRHMIVLPMSQGFRLFGSSELTLIAPTLIFKAVLLWLTFAATRRTAGVGAALIAIAVLATLPLLASSASVSATDIPEAFFVLASVWAFHFAWQRRTTALFVASGVMAGFAFITRETTLALLVVYLLLFLANYGGWRLAYVWMGLGFALVVGADTAYLWLGSGDPLFRLHVSMRGVEQDNPSMADRFQTQPGFDRHGVLTGSALLQPFLMIFANQNFSVLYWLAIPATIWLAVSRDASATRRVARLFGLLALIWFLVLSYGLTFLWIVPRYQMVSACALVVPLVIAFDRLWRAGHRAAAAVPVLALVTGGLLIISISDRQPLFGERALVAFTRTADGLVRTDPSTLRGATWLLQREGLEGRVLAEPPGPGDLYFLNVRSRRGLPASWSVRQAGQDWTPIARFEEPPRHGFALVDAVGLRSVLPTVVLRKLSQPPRVAEVFRVGPSPAPPAR